MVKYIQQQCVVKRFPGKNKKTHEIMGLNEESPAS
jgi:hypothetical protein